MNSFSPRVGFSKNDSVLSYEYDLYLVGPYQFPMLDD